MYCIDIMKNLFLGVTIIMSFIIISSLTYTNSIFAQSANQTSTLQSPSLSQQQQNSFCKLTESDL